MNIEDITVSFDYKDIEKKTQDEKLNLLLKIAFANHSTLKKHGEILFGNGKEGLCDIARNNKRLIRWIISIVSISIIGFAGILFTHIGK